MPRMIADAERVLDQLGDPPSSPDRPKKAAGFRSLSEQAWQLRQLSRAEQGLSPRSRMCMQSLGARQLRALEPLADGL
jgi:hypothetical protein